jgi:hypothetical protein
MSVRRVALVLLLAGMLALGLAMPTSCAQPVVPVLIVTPAVGALVTGQPLQLSVMRRFPLGPTELVTDRVTYVSSNKNVATVTDKGLILPQTEAGPVVIHIADPLSDAFADVSFTVAVVEIVSIDVSPGPSVVMAPGTTQRFVASARFNNGVTKDVTDQLVWVSTNEAVAKVVSTGSAADAGLPPIGTVSAVAAGDTTVTATDPHTSVQGGVIVFVRPITAELEAILVSPNPAAVAPGATLQFSALGVFSDGTTREVTNLVGWSSSVSSVATISGSGLASAATVGDTTITASAPAALPSADAGAASDAGPAAAVSGSAALRVR